MNKENINYCPISVIDKEQLMLINIIECTSFSKNRVLTIYGKEFLIKTEPCKDIKNSGLYCLQGMKKMDRYELCFKNIESSFGIIPIIPYKYVSKIAKLNDNGLYELGHYPQNRFNEISFAYSLAKSILKNLKIQDEKTLGKLSHDIFESLNPQNISESKYVEPVLGEFFSTPETVDNKVTIKHNNIYKITDIDGNETKVIPYYDGLAKIETVEWIKSGEYLVCTKILFNCPVHTKNDYIQNDDIKSFDDTFLKWYIDNIFFKDLFKYTDLTFMKKQMTLAIDEDIDTKLKEIEKLKQLKANLILQQQSEEHLIDTAQRNITSLFRDDGKEQIVRIQHK